MLIGAVEAVTPENVSGWIYSPHMDLFGTTALAFLDGKCIGSGRVDVFRPDLAEAGLSHGKLGFHFSIQLPEEEAVGRVVVSPEGCEALLVQRGSKVVGPSEAGEAELVGGRLPGRDTVSWLRKRKAISKGESDFLAALNDFGVAAWPLRLPPAEEGSSGPRARTAARHEAAAEIIELCDMAGTRVGRAEFFTTEELAEALADAENPISQAGLLVFYADRTLAFSVVEGSHRTPKRDLIADALDRGILYTVEPDGLLLMHRRCAFRLEHAEGEHFTVHYPLAAP